jgi:acyl-CoA synthetase (AMP-forming)/AMP-acid ligase II
MTGPEHYRRSEQLAEQAYKYLGQEDEQVAAAAWAAAAHVHATLALAAATAFAQSSSYRAKPSRWRAISVNAARASVSG